MRLELRHLTGKSMPATKYTNETFLHWQMREVEEAVLDTRKRSSGIR